MIVAGLTDTVGQALMNGPEDLLDWDGTAPTGAIGNGGFTASESLTGAA